MLTNDNKCYSIGRKEYGRLGLGEVENDVVELTLIPSLNDKKIVDICCGEMSSFAMTADGKVYSFGMGASSLGTGDDDDVLIPKLIIGAQVKDKILIKVASGGQHSLFVVQAAPVVKFKTFLISFSISIQIILAARACQRKIQENYRKASQHNTDGYR